MVENNVIGGSAIIGSIGGELADRLAKSFTLLHEFERDIEHALRPCHEDDRRDDALFCQTHHHVFEALVSLSELIGLGHDAIVEKELRCIGRLKARFRKDQSALEVR